MRRKLRTQCGLLFVRNRFCALDFTSEMLLMDCGHSENFPLCGVREFSGGGQSCAEARHHFAACYWAAFLLICHGGRRPRYVVAGPVERGPVVGSTRADVCGDRV